MEWRGLNDLIPTLVWWGPNRLVPDDDLMTLHIPREPTDLIPGCVWWWPNDLKKVCRETNDLISGYLWQWSNDLAYSLLGMAETTTPPANSVELAHSAPRVGSPVEALQISSGTLLLYSITAQFRYMTTLQYYRSVQVHYYCTVLQLSSGTWLHYSITAQFRFITTVQYYSSVQVHDYFTVLQISSGTLLLYSITAQFR
jgi:hypothetical protein